MTFQLGMLGPLTVSRDGRALTLPASRKVRALLAYLALAPRAVSRQRLCELFWDSAADPRAELRWHLSKLRVAIGKSAIHDDDDGIRLELEDACIDALQVQRAIRADIDALETDQARDLQAHYRGEFLEGLELDHCAEFMGWVIAQRRIFRGGRVALLRRLVRAAPQEEILRHIEKWIEIEPFDLEAHERLFDWLARRSRFHEGDEHLAVAVRLFSREGYDCMPLRKAWRTASMRRTAAPAGKPTTHATELAYDCYLLGRQHLSRMMQRGLDEGQQMFQRAIELDPGYGPAWAGLATVHAYRHEWFDAGKESLALADHASRRALEIAPQLAEAHVARGLVRSSLQEYGDATGEFQQAMRANPYLFDAYYFFARAAVARGDMERAADMFRLAMQARPTDFQSAILLALPLRALGRDDAARDALADGVRRAELVLDLNPVDGRALSLGAAALVDIDQTDRGLEWGKRVLDLYPDDTSALVNVACMHARIGDSGKALDVLEQVFARGFGKRDWVLNDPDYDILRTEPRFERMLNRMK